MDNQEKLSNVIESISKNNNVNKTNPNPNQNPQAQTDLDEENNGLNNNKVDTEIKPDTNGNIVYLNLCSCVLTCKLF